ncbi:NAD(P)-dependent oxidoreductase [Chryseobacterium sp. MFBS3-17]|uniref:NAD(P)-dependent oxidoreductase n=1 Tax=Chryseobacterium sp. MFBS3-17 TaxID=2886689 RepID=UPI001D0EF171|nr:NAD(P)-dependent oxidoreductase [Chryseobacterium sp. MFBS3-17]MCC2590590.1 NAD(P)-binding domain-containing protein [Chryseobacterium sp. MFBS3-17]
MKILQLDKNDPLIAERLTANCFEVHEDHESAYEEILEKIHLYEGIIIRSRIPLDENFLLRSSHLKFIARVGAGMENINCAVAEKLGIHLISSPEGNRDSVAEHVVGMLMILMHRLFIASVEVKNGIWKREENRGDELMGKTFGIIGYGNMGKAVARRLSGFGCTVIFHDILPGLSDQYATQVSLDHLKSEADVISLHLPITPETHHLVDAAFISEMKKDFYLINTARGKNVKTKDLVEALKSGKVKGAALDVLEFEKSSFEHLEGDNDDLRFLLQSENVLVTPHIAGWTHQSKKKLACFIADKILKRYNIKA